MTKKSQDVLDFLNQYFPDARCALDFHDDFTCLVAVLLSAQTTDNSVNKVTPALFLKYPDAFAMSKADIEDIKSIIKSLGLYENKAKSLLRLSNKLVSKYNGEIPSIREELTSLAGVGIKTANVFLAERRKVPCIPVDTHITRVAIRLKYAKVGENVVNIEKALEKAFPVDTHIKLHHQLITFGRRICDARNPKCDQCSLGCYCRDFKTFSSKVKR